MSKFQITNPNPQNPKRFEFGISCLEFVWILEFVVWNFPPAAGNGASYNGSTRPKRSAYAVRAGARLGGESK
jgi:hypothetical protein